MNKKQEAAEDRHGCILARCHFRTSQNTKYNYSQELGCVSSPPDYFRTFFVFFSYLSKQYVSAWRLASELPREEATMTRHCSNLHHWRLGPYHFNSQYAVAAPPKPNFLYFHTHTHTHTHSRMRARVGIGQALTHCTKSFPLA